MTDYLAQLRERFEACSTRERYLVLAALLILPVMAWDTLLQGPLGAERDRLEQRLVTLTTAAAEQVNQAKIAAVTAARDPDRDTRARLDEAREQADAQRRRLDELAGELIDPRAMGRILRDVLEHEGRLSLVRLESLGSEVLEETRSDPVAPAGGPAPTPIYRHGMRIEFRGSYLDTLAYLMDLEGLSWRLYWDTLAIDVAEWPLAGVVLEVHTLSLGEGWIGV